jgi:uncharacterized membrane protein
MSSTRMDVRDAKHPTTPLAGPYGHPFHPILVTVPIGAWTASLVFDLVSRAADDPDAFSDGAYWLVGIGILGALAAAVFGLLDWRGIPRGTAAFRTATTHLVINGLVILAFMISFVARRASDQEQTPIGLIVLSIVALAALGVSGWLGGKLSYRYGVRVADEATQAEGYAGVTTAARTATGR